MAGYPGRLTAKCYINVGDKKVLWYEIDENENVTWYLPPEESEYYKRKILDNIGENMSRYIADHPDSALWGQTNEC